MLFGALGTGIAKGVVSRSSGDLTHRVHLSEERKTEEIMMTSFSQRLKHTFYPTHRKVLALNMLILFLSLCFMACLSLFLGYLFYDNNASNEDNVFLNWLILGIIQMAMSWVCVIGLRGVHLLSFEMLLLYFWGVTMFFGPLILAAVGGLDFYIFMEIWLKHSWEEPICSKVSLTHFSTSIKVF